MTAGDPNPDPIGDALWKKVLADFEADGPHAAYLEHSRATGRLPDAAKRYRGYKDSLGESADELTAARIGKRLAAITTLAVSELQASRERRLPGWGRKIFTIIAVFLCLVAMSLLARAILLALR